MLELTIHPRIGEKHPELAESSIREVWFNFLASQHRKTPNNHQIVRVGIAHNGDVFELIAIEDGGRVLIYHTFTPPTKSILRELGL